MDWVSYYLSTVKTGQQDCLEVETRSLNQELLHSNNLVCSHDLCKGLPKSCVHVKEDETLVGSYGIPNVSLVHSKKPLGDINESAKKPATSKTHTARPAVLGSLSSNDNRKPETLKPHASSSVSRKSAHISTSGSFTRKSNMVFVNEKSKVEQCKGDSSTVSKHSVLLNSKCISPKAHSKFCMQSASDLSSVNSIDSGVGKKSNLQKLPPNPPASLMVKSQPNRFMCMAQRLGSNAEDAKAKSVQTLQLSDSNSHTCQSHQEYHSQSSHVQEKVQQDTDHDAVLHASYLSDTEFPALVNPEAVSDRGNMRNMNKCNDHNSGDYPWLSDARDCKASSSIDCTNTQSRYTQSQGQDIDGSVYHCISQHVSSAQNRTTQSQRQDIDGSECQCISRHASSAQSINTQRQGQDIDGSECQCISRHASSAQSINKQSQRQDINDSECQCICRHVSSDCQHVPYQCNQPVFTQNVSPCVSEGSSCCYCKEAVSMQNECVNCPSIQHSPSEENHWNSDGQVVGNMQEHQHKLYVETDHTDAVRNLFLSELPATQSFDASASLFMGTSRHSDMSDILENFPSFSSKLFEEKAPNAMCRSSTSGEMRYLTDCLEKERFRRKHCEEHILKQDAKLLEMQQQLAVAISTARRKDVMVEQLDKQLAKFVEGWKKKEAEKDEHIRVLKQEKQQTDKTLQSQQAMISNFEQELSRSVEELNKEKSNSAQEIDHLKNEICEARRDVNLAEETLSQEKQNHATVKDELNHLKQLKELMEKRALEAEEHLMMEQDKALKKEQELLDKINVMAETKQKMVDLQLLNLDEENKRYKEIVTENEELKNQLQKSMETVKQLLTEKETHEAEVADIQMKFKNEQQKLEQDACAQMEKKIADQASKFYSQMEGSLEEAAACHAKQVVELNAKHQQDLEQQAQVLNTELLTIQRHYQVHVKELEERLQVLTSENTSLKQSQVVLESQRMEVLNKLQVMMQSQWNEAVSLLIEVPQKKRLSSSLLLHQDSDHLASDKIKPVNSPSWISSLPQPMFSQETTNEMTPVTIVSRISSMPQPVFSPETTDESSQGVLSCQHAPAASYASLEVRENMNTTPAVVGSLKRSELRVSESCQVGHHSSLTFAAPSSGPQPSCCHEPPNCHNQSDLNNGKRFLSSPAKMNIMPAPGGSHQEQLKHRYHTLSMKSPQKPTLQCRSDSSHSSAKSGPELPPVSRKSHIFNENHLVTPPRRTGFKPNYSPRKSQPQSTLRASLVDDAAISSAKGRDGHIDMKLADRLGGTNEASPFAIRQNVVQNHVNMNDISSGCCKAISLQINQSHFCKQVEEHGKHEGHLQNYIPKLLQNEDNSVSSDSNTSLHIPEVGIRDSVEDLSGSISESVSEVKYIP
ncbi:hypothetical protein BsWGS_03744 [Bradybaena similaris]